MTLCEQATVTQCVHISPRLIVAAAPVNHTAAPTFVLRSGQSSGWLCHWAEPWWFSILCGTITLLTLNKIRSYSIFDQLNHSEDKLILCPGEFQFPINWCVDENLILYLPRSGDKHTHIHTCSRNPRWKQPEGPECQSARCRWKFPQSLISQVHAMSGQVQPCSSLIDRDNLALSHSALGHDIEVHQGIVVFLIALRLCRLSCQSH